MATAINQFRPDYAVPPGWVLEERLVVQGISHAEFARRCGRSPKLISEIIAGKASLEPETALQFEKVLGVDASIWLGIEADYQLHRARESEAADAEGASEWVKGFPVKELVKRGAIRRPKTDADAVSELLAFFRVGSVDAWKIKYGSMNVAYRHSPSFKSDESALATWAPPWGDRGGGAGVRRLQQETVQSGSKGNSRINSCADRTGASPLSTTLQSVRCRTGVGQTIAEDGPERCGMVAISKKGRDPTERSSQVRRSSVVQLFPRSSAYSAA